MDYLQLIDDHRDDMIRDLQKLIAIPSVAAPPLGDLPFGKEVHRALEFMLDLGKEAGFTVQNIDNYGGHIDFGGHVYDASGNLLGPGERTMGILVHLDVVPAGSNWSGDPFQGWVEEDKIYGRGAVDDKGPAMAVFYAMKALKEAGIEPETKVRLILGLDEETGWKGMGHYLSKVPAPDFGFTPDACFPVIHGEMGLLIFELAKKINKTTAKGLEVRSISGGQAPNMVADTCRVVLRADRYDIVREKLKTFEKETNHHIEAKGIGKSLELMSRGVSAHGAHPERGINAISIMLAFLHTIDVTNEEMNHFLDFYHKHIGFDLTGSQMGCDIKDDISGPLIFNVGMIQGNDEAVKLTINIRYPVTASEDQVYNAMLPTIHAYDLGLIKVEHKAPIYLPADDPMVVDLMEIYARHTGDRESKPLVIGGGTYARAIKNAVAFGLAMPDAPSVEHQKDEYVTLQNLTVAAKIYADAINTLAEGRQMCYNDDEINNMKL